MTISHNSRTMPTDTLPIAARPAERIVLSGECKEERHIRLTIAARAYQRERMDFDPVANSPWYCDHIRHCELCRANGRFV